jgi:aspartyl/asparaginyl beta-hydroxylase (cupin superfamily)
MEHDLIKTEIDRAISIHLSGIEKQLNEMRELLTRIVIIEERQSAQKIENENLRRDVSKLFDQVRLLQTTTEVQATNVKNTDQILWKVISGILALGLVVIEFFKK